MRRFISLFVVAVVLSWATTANACPMCKDANESNDRRPKAYMYSILFMLAVPPSILTAFGVKFYQLSKQHSDNDEIQE